MSAGTRTSGGAAPARPDWRIRVGVPLGAALLAVLGRTWRVRYRSGAAWESRRAAGDGTVLALWHGQLLPLAWAFRRRGIVILVSEHRDGEIIAQLLHHLGYGTIRGSTSRGGARALIEMIRTLRSGATVGVTPDGPRGPARKFAPGALVAAQRAGVPVIPLHASVDRAWRLGSWDSFVIPKPFARIVVDHGEPAFVGGATPEEAALEAPRFEAMIVPRGDTGDA